MEEKKDVAEMIEELNEVSKNVGTMGFSIKYTATPGNVKIHKAFKQFAFDTSNNEYLAAIGKLLEYYDMFRYIALLEERISVLEQAERVRQDVQQKEDESKKEIVKNKTF